MRHTALFCAVDEAELDRQRLAIDDLRFAAGVTLYRQGDPGDHLFTVRSGLIKLLQYLPNGQQRIVRLHRPGDAAGLEATLDVAYEHTAVAVSAAAVCRLSAGGVASFAASHPALGRRLMEQWHHAVVQADAWLTMLSTGCARARVARLFLYLKGETPAAECMFLAREEAAAILGITTETASRIVAELRRDGVISGGAGNVFRCDVGRLEKIALN